MIPHFVLGRENVPCVAEVVNRSLKADCTDFTMGSISRVYLQMFVDITVYFTFTVVIIRLR